MSISNSTNTNRNIPFFDKIGYGIGNFSAGIAMQMLAAYLVFYCTAILNIPGSLVGIAVSIGIVWDAVTDPVMGYFSDITKSKIFGRRHLYILTGALGIAITNFFLWRIDSSYSTQIKFAILLFYLLAIKTFMTIYVTPYTALGAELSNDYNERTSIQGIKTVFFLIGLAFVSVIGMYFFFMPTAEFPIGQLNPASYKNIGSFSSVIVIIFAVLCYALTKKYIPLINKIDNEKIASLNIKGIFSSFKRVILNKAFKSVAFTYMFINISSALFTSIGMHVFTYTFTLSSQQIAVIVGIQLAVSIISQPFWSIISKRIDKKPSMMAGQALCLLSSIVFLILVFMRESVSGSVLYFIPAIILLGFGTGGLYTLPLSMIADIIDTDELETGIREEGTYYGCLTFFYKLSQSITLLLVGFILDIMKFDSSLNIQAESTVTYLGILLCIGSSLSFVAACFSLSKYKLNKLKIEHAQKEILKRSGAGI